MKKILSLLLALAIALSCAVCAAAAPKTQSIHYTLPSVTGIKAVWNGKVSISAYDLTPCFDFENVKITLTYKDGGTEALKYWSDSGNGWWWDIFYLVGEKTAKGTPVTFYYRDSKLEEAYLKTIDEDWYDYDSDAFLAKLPKTTITVPADAIEKAVAARVIPLRFKERAAVASLPYYEDDTSAIFAFTPEKSGKYYFYSAKSGRYVDPYASLRDERMEDLAYDDDSIGLNFCIAARLEAGKTYYLFVSNYGGDEEARDFIVTVSDKKPRLNALQWIFHYLLGGWAMKMLSDISYLRFLNALDTRTDIFGAYIDMFRNMFPW